MKPLVSLFVVITVGCASPRARLDGLYMGNIPAGQKLSGLATAYAFTAQANRRPEQSYIYHNGAHVHTQRHAETMGNGVTVGGITYVPAEKYGAIGLRDGRVVSTVRMRYIIAACVHNGVPVTHEIDRMWSTGRVRDMRSGAVAFDVPVKALATGMTSHKGRLYLGLSGPQPGFWMDTGAFHQVAGHVAGVASFDGDLYGSVNNVVVKLQGVVPTDIRAIPCEKITDIRSHGDLLWVCGSSPDQLWTMDGGGKWRRVAVMPYEEPIGGAWFDQRTAPGYWGRSIGGTQAEVYRVRCD